MLDPISAQRKEKQIPVPWTALREDPLDALSLSLSRDKLGSDILTS